MYLGIEIGGTKLQLGIGAGDGRLAALWRGQVDAAAAAAGIRAQITQALPQLFAQAALEPAGLRGAGIGFGGPVDDATQTIIKSHQVPGWDGFPLARWISQLVGVPAVLGNDADVAGLAEALLGAGAGQSPIFYITLGSGIGGGLIIGGHIHRGAGRGAAEIGHVRIAVPEADGLAYRPLEQIASGWAIGRAARSRLGLEVSARDVAQLARQGDEAALGVLDHAWQALAEAICHVIALTAPRRIVIGGGVALMGEALLFEPLRRLVAERVFRPFAGQYDIVPAALGEEMVVHGALALARQRTV